MGGNATSSVFMYITKYIISARLQVNTGFLFIRLTASYNGVLLRRLEMASWGWVALQCSVESFTIPHSK